LLGLYRYVPIFTDLCTDLCTDVGRFQVLGAREALYRRWSARFTADICRHQWVSFRPHRVVVRAVNLVGEFQFRRLRGPTSSTTQLDGPR